MNASHRIRLLTGGLHASLLHIPDVRDQIFFFLTDTASAYQTESILGTWCMAAHDVDRQVSSYVIKSWNEAVSLSEHEQRLGKLILDETLITHLLSFIQRTLLDPSAVYHHLNPTQPVIVPTPSRKVPGLTSLPARREEEQVSRSKTEEEEENNQDRKARMRVGAFGAVGWILGR